MGANFPVNRVPMEGVSNFREFAKAAALKQAKDASGGRPVVKSQVVDFVNQLSLKAFRHQIIRTPNSVADRASPMAALAEKKRAVLTAMYKEKNKELTDEELKKYDDLSPNDKKYQEIMQFIEKMEIFSKIQLNDNTPTPERDQIVEARLLMHKLDESKSIKTGLLAKRIDILCNSAPSENLVDKFVQIVTGEIDLEKSFAVSAKEREKLNDAAKQAREDRINTFVSNERTTIRTSIIAQNALLKATAVSPKEAQTLPNAVSTHAPSQTSQATAKFALRVVSQANDTLSHADTKHKASNEIHITSKGMTALPQTPPVTPQTLSEREKAFDIRLFSFLQMHHTIKDPSYSNEISHLTAEAEECYKCLSRLKIEELVRPALDRFETQIAHLRLCLSKNSRQYLNSMLPKFYGNSTAYFARIYSDHVTSSNRKNEHLWQNVFTKEYRFSQSEPLGEGWKKLSPADLNHVLIYSAKNIDTIKDPLLIKYFQRDLNTTIEQLPEKSAERIALEKAAKDVAAFKDAGTKPSLYAKNQAEINKNNLGIFIDYLTIVSGAAKQVESDEISMYQSVEFVINQQTGEIRYRFELPEALPKNWRPISLIEVERTIIDLCAKDKTMKSTLLTTLNESFSVMPKGKLKKKFSNKIQELENNILNTQHKTQPWMVLTEFLKQRSNYKRYAAFIKQIKGNDYQEHLRKILIDDTNNQPFDEVTKAKLERMRLPNYIPTNEDLAFVNVNLLKATRALVLIEEALKDPKALITVANPNPEVQLETKQQALIGAISNLVKIGNKINTMDPSALRNEQEIIKADDTEVGIGVSKALEIISQKDIEISPTSPQWTYDELEHIKHTLFLIEEEIKKCESISDSANKEKDVIDFIEKYKSRLALLKSYQEALLKGADHVLNFAENFAQGIFVNLLETRIDELQQNLQMDDKFIEEFKGFVFSFINGVNRNELAKKYPYEKLIYFYNALKNQSKELTRLTNITQMTTDELYKNLENIIQKHPEFIEFQKKIMDKEKIRSLEKADLDTLIRNYAFLRSIKNSSTATESETKEKRYADDDQTIGQIFRLNQSQVDLSIDTRDPLQTLITHRIAQTEKGKAAWQKMFEEQFQ
jgi:hypothetical protein